MAEYYDKELDILDRAYSADGGIKLVFKDLQSLMAYRMKLYRRRFADRHQTALVHKIPTTIGLSPYDTLIFLKGKEPDGRPSLVIRKGPEGLEIWDKDGDPIEIR